jgi:hypothetical protein
MNALTVLKFTFFLFLTLTTALCIGVFFESLLVAVALFFILFTVIIGCSLAIVMAIDTYGIM